MKSPSPFERVAQLPALAAFCHGVKSRAGAGPGKQAKNGAFKPSGEGELCLHGAVRGLIGAARSLAVGALARGRAAKPSAASRKPKECGEKARPAPAVVLAVVENLEAALDMIGDLRAFHAAGESAGESRGKKRKTQAEGARTKKTNPQSAIRNPKSKARPAPGSPSWELDRRLPWETLLFPAWDVLPTETDRPEGHTLAGRQRVVERLRAWRAPEASAGGKTLPGALVLAAPIAALMQPLESPEAKGGTVRLRAESTWDPIELGRKLVALGFERTPQVEVRGEFALRGGILDIFPHTAERPFRVDFFGDVIESICFFDPLLQRSEEAVDEVEIADASPERLRKLFSPSAAGGPWTLLEHLPPGAAVIWNDPGKLAQRAELFRASLVSGRSLCVEYAALRKKARVRFDTLDLLPPEGAEAGEREGEGMGRRENGVAPAGERLAPEPAAEESGTRGAACTSLQRLQGEISAHAGAWKKLAATRMALYVFCETRGDRRRLETLLAEAGVLPAPTLHLAIGRLSGGFDLRAAGLAAISDREILGRRKHAQGAAPARRQQKTAETRPISSFFELRIGEYVVHAAHGMARYLGLARLEKSGRMEDYLTLQFAERVKLYVPAAHIHWVSRYVGQAGAPELSRLGGKVWARKKQRAQAAVRELAEDLLRVQAARRNLPGIVHGPDTDWQAPFEAAFPYEETPDQHSAVRAVKKDMQATCPMDRLLCGDVGFGKTEVAVRAAFKTVCAGKQAAVLVPTTLLCEQHGRTFIERFAGYPVTVETLSRFKSKREQRAILGRLASGRLDVVVGTHRLLQKDVAFRDLGLAIVDEEQRFGVQHKEFFKRLRRSVDVLTLTATPIPRTLHMAMLGLRDISNLATPPRNRRSIVTKVARVSDDLLRRAILREVARGGQLFVVHPRVHDIEALRARLVRQVPEASFAVGHGQMENDELEAVMRRFLHGEADVLVSTTIVESGLDIPTANTILVHEADRFGLAELHQLRGRVGRSETQAYCYLLLPEGRSITPEARRRLQALEEYDALGAGFQLALKDLEIRGAGNVLGAQQSGQIAEVGYDLYCKLLHATVQELKGQPPPEEELEVNVRLRGAAFIPETYVEDEKIVLELYRRLHAATRDDRIEALRAEWVDRFGPLPPPAERLFEEAKLRQLARAAHVPYIGWDSKEARLVFKLYGWDLKMTDRALRGLPEIQGVRVPDGETLSFAVPGNAPKDEARLHAMIRNLLSSLAHFRQQHGRKIKNRLSPLLVEGKI